MVITKEAIIIKFKGRYKARQFIESRNTLKLIELLLKNNRISQIFEYCRNGKQPLQAVVHDIEDFADKNKNSPEIFKNGKISPTWKQNVGMLIGAIVNLDNYVADKRRKFKEEYKYFRSASTFRKA
ncbi:hypothetical protein [uncultured Anaerovibrio sp.]|uniref:hypothetical protein n=1 Tax=uncultured Anaerovibrio sp. TaxID=361586 RepID=UPI0025E4AD79|nr:hypothetical protein [uncultured Anaerovibrio sp.]